MADDGGDSRRADSLQHRAARPAGDASGAGAGAPAVPAAAPAPEIILREQSRWVAAQWSDLPGWQNDRIAEAWPALLLSCGRPAAGWQQLCALARAAPPMDEVAVRDWIQTRLRPYRIESLTVRLVDWSPVISSR